MTQIPRDENIDSTLTLLSEGYEFISKRCQRYQSDIFETRLLFQRTLCLTGEEGAQVFYDNNYFIRKKAAPKRLNKTLFGQGGVQGLDGYAHRHRKEMFMSLMNPASISKLSKQLEENWHLYINRWEQQQRVVLFDEAEELLSRSVCAWAGISLPEEEVKTRAQQLSSMIAGSGAIGIEHYKARFSRKQAEQWIAEQVKKTRAQPEPKDMPLKALPVFSWHRDPQGRLLDIHVAAVEILNILRPTVAIGRFIVFAALALHEHPACRQQLQQGSDEEIARFTQEVRRFYPFFPFAAARTKTSFSWKGYHIPKGRRVLLDLYGINHDPRNWKHPDTFDPERFRHWDKSPFNFIPQGGGDFLHNHRCAGEWITIDLMKTAIKQLTRHMQYEVPPQDMSFTMNDFPAAPRSRFVIANVKAV